MYLKIMILAFALMAFVGCEADKISSKSTFEELILPTIKQNMDYEQTSKYYKDLCDKGEIRACALLIDYLHDLGDMKQNLHFMQEALKRYQHIANLYEKLCLDTESSESKQACEIMAYASYGMWFSVYNMGFLILNNEGRYDISPQKLTQIFSQRLGNVSIPQLQDLQKPIHKACDNEFLRPCLFDMIIFVFSMKFENELVDDAKVSAMRDRVLQLAQTRLKANSSDIIALKTLVDMYHVLYRYYFNIEFKDEYELGSHTLSKEEAKTLLRETVEMFMQYHLQMCEVGIESSCELYNEYKAIR